MKLSRCAVSFAGIAAAALVVSAGAQKIYDTSFENPPFNTGTINGQDGWANGSGSGNTQSIVDSFARTGSQSLFWDNSSLVSFYSVRRAFDGQNGAISGSTPLEISVWMYINQGTGPDRLYGLYAMNTNTTMGGTALGLTISGSGGIRAGTSWSETYSGSPLHTDASLVGNWVQVVLQYDGVGGSTTVYDSSMNEVWTNSYAAVNLPNSNGAGTVWSVNVGSDYNATTNRVGSAYMDDFNVRIVPGPGGLLALGLGMALVGRRRRRC